jgi:glycerol-3-phosphate acyltransferase PlsX
MGGDHAPASVVEGARIAAERYPSLSYIFYGKQPLLEPLIAAGKGLESRSRIHHTDMVVSSDDKPSAALRQGKESSMRLAIDAVRDGAAQGVVSAGNTGALMAMAKIALRMLPGISRPAIATLMPTLRGESVMLDLGANVECDAQELYQFAVMGEAFAKVLMGLPNPSIGLLNVGSEEMKGHEEIKNAHQLLRECSRTMNYKGFIEGNDIPMGAVDVVVTDGFTGNIALKMAEGVFKLVAESMKSAILQSTRNKIGYAICKPAFATVKERLDPRNHNGAMFIGLNGVAVKSHGSADAISFANAICVAYELINQKINERITEELGQNRTALATPEGEALPKVVA